MLRVAVVDGQGAAVGAAIIKKMRQAFGETIEIWALGTNAIATSQMLRAGANRGTSGEAAVCHCVHQVDIIIGSISVLVCNSFMGECSPRMVEAIGSSKATKMMLPITQEQVGVVGQGQEPLPHLIDALLDKLLGPLVRTNGSNECEKPRIEGIETACTCQAAEIPG